ncbi:MAG TPA: hypothetical protein VFA06_09460 [Actinocrinis sp.]|uniref:hypothetical protein n=1 Tax=Actinocrinis sp. TaxID=1920516 RepID=UPI002D643837|nr:hypothetical protein [Actinocrinis sp.]HZU56079.1 hypothetical protein [Actinocrinis sp.]
MARTISPEQAHRHHLAFTLNTDGVRHPLENTGSLLTAILGVVALVCAFFPSMHLVASWAGLAGMGTGLWAQMISATTAERFVNITGLVLSGIGLLFGLAHGGLY